MAWWLDQPNTYKHPGFINIPKGSHRVRVCKVEVERFSKQKKCFKITLDVSGYHGKLWHYLWYDPEKIERCKKEFCLFFCSFEIEDWNIADYKKWVGAYGAVSVCYEYREHEFEAKYLTFLCGKQKNKLPPWKDASPDTHVELFRELPF
jgi:hypothetical protein